MTVEYILDTKRGLFEAPAGCGKTHLIVDSLRYDSPNPVLILTHTTAGVTALRKRLSKQGVPSNRAVISTIDGWATRMASYFPSLMAINGITPETNKGYYPLLRQQAVKLLSQNFAVKSVVAMSYSRLMVDEYQDCDIDQHQLVTFLADTIPTVVFGDPLQAIFTFGSPMPCWNEQVQGFFGSPEFALSTPHRWLNAGTGDLGHWLLQLRQSLLQSRSVNLTNPLPYVNIRPLSTNQQQNITNQHKLQYSLNSSYPSESVLIIGDSKRVGSRHLFAQRATNLDVIEPVDLSDIVKSCEMLDQQVGISLVESFLKFHATLMTGVDTSNTLKRINSLSKGTSRKPPSPKEAFVAKLITSRATSDFVQASKAIISTDGTYVFRKAALSAFQQALSLALSDNLSIKEAMVKVREKRRISGEDRIAHRAVGSTLLLKGLECDHCIILDANNLDMANFYVAATRGAKSLSIYSKSMELNF